MMLNVRSAALLAVLATAAMAAADPVLQFDLVRNNFPSGTFGVYLLGETQPTTFNPATNPTRDAGPFAVNPNKQPTFAGTNLFYVAGVSNGFNDIAAPSAGNSGRQDLITFTVEEDPNNNGVIDVTRRRVANAEGLGSQNKVGQFSTNSVANDGTVALKLSLGTGNPNAFGTIPATNTGLVVFGTAGANSTSDISEFTPSSGAGFTLLGATPTVTFNLPSIGSNNKLLLNANFNRQITGSKTGLTGGAYLATTRVLATLAAGATDNRGSITYNDQVGLAAILRTKQTAVTGTTPINHVTAVAVYKVTFDASGNPELRDLAGNLSALGTEIALPTVVATVNGKSLDLVGTNYFGSSAFSGPVQIAMNDNGDIALATVAVDVTDTTDTGQNQERGSRTDKRILVNRRLGSSYSGWLTAARSGVNAQVTVGGDVQENPGSGDFVSVNPVSTVNSIALGNPSLDNDGNVYFAAATQAVIFGTGGTTVRSAIFRALRSGTVYAPADRVLQEGDVISDPEQVDPDRTVTFLPLATATSDLTNGNIRYPANNSFNPSSALHDPQGGVIVPCRITDPNTANGTPTRWNFLYVSYR